MLEICLLNRSLNSTSNHLKGEIDSEVEQNMNKSLIKAVSLGDENLWLREDVDSCNVAGQIICNEGRTALSFPLHCRD